MKIGLVLSKVPAPSETFFISKVKGLQKAGHQVILFANGHLKNKICKFYVQKVKNFWFEIDTHNDIKITSKILR